MHVANGESAYLFAEVPGPAHLTRLPCASTSIAASGELCYCDQAVVDREVQGHLAPSAAVDLYAVTLARWFGVSSGELDTILRDL